MLKEKKFESRHVVLVSWMYQAGICGIAGTASMKLGPNIGVVVIGRLALLLRVVSGTWHHWRSFYVNVRPDAYIPSGTSLAAFIGCAVR